MNLRVPVSWLREFLKTDVAAKTIANYLSLCGPSVEKIIKHGEDYIFDVEVTSNRPDVFSVYGLAREAHAILSNENHQSQLIKPKGLNLILEPDTSSILPLDVVIKNKSLCPRFTAIVLDNVTIKPSPAFIRNRLQACGIRSINNIVDISNYLMLELGQPMHTFDYDKVKGARMILRESKEGERITTLDGQIRRLPNGAIVIEDTQRLIDLCGIMGGVNSQISRRTKRVVLFVQTYDTKSIRKTTQALSFRTEAASRFEKGVDVEAIPQALARAVYLAKKTTRTKVASELIDIQNQKKISKPIELKLIKLNKYLGINFDYKKATKILDLLGFVTKMNGQKIIAEPPSWRFIDIEDDVDLIEEIARIYGYWKLPSKLPEGQIPQAQKDELEKAAEIKKALKFQGLTEVISYSIISKDFLKLTQIKEKNAVELANPLTDQWQFMRPTLVLSLANVIAQNQNIRQYLRVFEIAKTYVRQDNDLPKQDLMLAIALQNGDFYQIKGVVENVLEILNREAKWQELTTKSALFAKRESAQITIDGHKVGQVGTLNTRTTDYFGIKGLIAACEINLTTVYRLPSTTKTYKPIPKYPPVIEDISAVFGFETPLERISQEVQKAGSPLVTNVKIIDVFEDKKIGKHKKSVTLRLIYQKPDGTPNKEEVTETRNKISSVLEKSFFATIRK